MFSKSWSSDNVPLICSMVFENPVYHSDSKQFLALQNLPFLDLRLHTNVLEKIYYDSTNLGFREIQSRQVNNVKKSIWKHLMAFLCCCALSSLLGLIADPVIQAIGRLEFEDGFTNNRPLSILFRVVRWPIVQESSTLIRQKKNNNNN